MKPEDWLITFADYSFEANNDGRPFGDNSSMAKRALNQQNPWDERCTLTVLNGGLDAMQSIRQEFQIAINDATSSTSPVGDRGHVYIAGWRFNPNRDMSDNSDESSSAVQDTAWNWVSKLMRAGIKVRILLWLPPGGFLSRKSAGFEHHIEAHFYAARLMRELNKKLMNATTPRPPNGDIGVIFLDSRVSERNSNVASHHQKFIVIRGIKKSVAFCGGLDLAYTRREAPQYGGGDWQSGNGIPEHNRNIEDQNVSSPKERQCNDLYERVYGLDRQIWHDQHLKLEGPIVKSLEEVFRERWTDDCFHKFIIGGNDKPEIITSSVISSSEGALERKPVTKEFERGNSLEIVFDRSALISGSLIVFLNGEQIPIEIPGGDTVISTPLPAIILVPSVPEIRIDPHQIKRNDKLKLVYEKYVIKPLPDANSVENTSGSAVIQRWQTIPLRISARTVGMEANSPYSRGEFSVMAGLVKACKRASELILIFDQYFWSTPYANLLSQQISVKPDLHLIIILPPHADSTSQFAADIQHRIRRNTLEALPRSRVGIYSLWNYLGINTSLRNKGIYCHAKVQAFDNMLLVCGSSNINRRSHSCDTELSCAVYDKDVVENYYRNIWKYLFKEPEIPFPNIDFNNQGWGKKFFDRFDICIKLTDPSGNRLSNLITDPWDSPIVTLPNGVPRYNPSLSLMTLEKILFNPGSLPVKVEDRIREGRGKRDVRLDDIVRRIEQEKDFVWRIIP
jgi:phosphatidylserine/phosphatidylglycerophosphate/cardiolipin synthase-like enzyme